MEYKLTSIGHEVGLQTRFRPDSVKQYTITVRKPDNSSEKGNSIMFNWLICSIFAHIS